VLFACTQGVTSEDTAVALAKSSLTAAPFSVQPHGSDFAVSDG